MKLRFILSEVGKGLSCNHAVGVTIILVILVSLFFVGTAGLTQVQVFKMKPEWYDRIEVAIYTCAINDAVANYNTIETTDAQIDVVHQKLVPAEMIPYAANVYEETKEKVYENFQRLNGNNALTQRTTPEMFQLVFRIKLVNSEQHPVVKEEFSGTVGTSKMRDQREVVEPLSRALDAARMAAPGLDVIMVVATILPISTAIRLNATSHEQKAQTTHYVGVLSLFIQAPSMTEGALVALVGAVFAIGTLFAGVRFIVQGWMVPSFCWMNSIGMGEVAVMTPILVLAAVALAAIASAFPFAKYTKA